jgi:prepilin-type N-terminal cleavage/methylation domain-containing protein
MKRKMIDIKPFEYIPLRKTIPQSSIRNPKYYSMGFTLIELLIVVAIIAILAAIAIPNFLAAQTRAKVSRVKGELRTIFMAVESYYVDSNSYLMDWRANPGDYQVSRHPELSTPISYISSVSFRDPFGGFATWNGMPMNYKVFNYKKLGGPAVSPGGYWNWGDLVTTETDHNGYCIESYGPDQKYSAIEWFDYRADDDANQIFRIYDPTNGITSNGDIARLGGSAYHVLP